MLATPAGDGTVTVRGDPDHPANFGRLCSKGAALGDTLAMEGRLLRPQVHGRIVGWDAALDYAARELVRIRDVYGPDAIAFYVSGQLLTEDYYVANKLMKGFIGTGNIDTNSRLCMASAVAGHLRAFGADAVPGCYEDLELADLVVLAGSNTAWCHPVVYQRLAQARERRPAQRIIVIDPRRTATCELADLHLPLRPGTDVMLFNGLLNYLRRQDGLDFAFLERHAEGYATALETARRTAPSVPQVAAACDLTEAAVAEFYALFAHTERVVTVFSQGVNQSSSGTDKVNSIINCHLATGRIGRPGMGPFSITGQPNAMGGREVGGMASTLAAHMSFDIPEDIERVARFWRAPAMASRPGLKAIALFDAIAAGRVKAVWVMATNPAVTLPDANRMCAALKDCELVIVSDCVHTDTTAYAHVLLPAAAWGEKDGTVTNSERRISRQRPFVPPPGEARPDWRIICEVAARMGFAAGFTYWHPADIFREHAALTGFENNGTRVFNISALADISDADYDALRPVQWPLFSGAPEGTARLFTDGRYVTPSGRARLVAVEPRSPANATGDSYPLVLNTGRVRDQWHTMTRTGNSPRLTGHQAEPVAEIHPDDARAYSVADGAVVEVASRWGSMLARVRITESQRQGGVFVPMHWNDRYAASGRVDAVVNPATDPVSGQPESKHTPVRLTPYPAQWYAFVLSRRVVDLRGHAGYWARAMGRGFQRYELAGTQTPSRWGAWARTLLGVEEAQGEWIDVTDGGAGRYRGARLCDGRLQACIYVGRDPRLPGREWLSALFECDSIDDTQRTSLLAGTAGASKSDAGRLVCACFGVGEVALRAAIEDRRVDSVDAIGRLLKAGTNCGSCIPELKALLAVNG